MFDRNTGLYEFLYCFSFLLALLPCRVTTPLEILGKVTHIDEENYLPKM